MNYDFHSNGNIPVYLTKPTIGYRRSYFRILLAMKLTVFLIAILSVNVYADAYAQRISMTVKNVSLQTVISELSKQSNYDFVFDEQYIKLAKPITINLKDAEMGVALAEILSGQPFAYEIFENSIIIRPNKSFLESIQSAIEQQSSIRGRVTDSVGTPLRGVTVMVKGTSLGTATDINGYYELSNVPENSILVFRLLSYQTIEVPANQNELNVVLRIVYSDIDVVAVTVNTGFQSLPKERATGSFVHIDNELINRRVSPNILERLEGVTNGLMFSGNFLQYSANDSPISIRGLSTIFANANPLIVVDNFPFDGDISNLNPNDVESITVLKDAAAASIWGARSGNGVIVINTKRGSSDSKVKISLNSNYTYGEKPDIFYGKNFLSSADFIDAERILFDHGYYNGNLINTPYSRPVVSPVIELYAQFRDELISEAQLNEQLSRLAQLDIRNDLSEYFYRATQSQQHNLNISGGNNKSSFYLSGGYNRNPSVMSGNDNDRVTFNTNVSTELLPNLSLTTGYSFSINHVNNNSPLGDFRPEGGKAVYYPYAQLADENGGALGLPRNYRYSYIEGLNGLGLLDWTYRPLQELSSADNSSRTFHSKLNLGAKYIIIPGLEAEFRYQHERQTINGANYRSEDTYFTRNLINLNTQIVNGALQRAIPLGGIKDYQQSNLAGNSIRGQLNYSKDIKEQHNIIAIMGVDAKKLTIEENAYRLYGYSDQIGTSRGVNYITQFAKFQDISVPGTIPYANRNDVLTDIFFSYFTNASYTYANTYTISASARIDQSNLFGVNINQKSIPLWSIGGLYRLSNDKFYNFELLENLALRATYGYNGNLDKSISTFTTAVFANSSTITGLPYVQLQNPPNPELRWEQIGVFNLGIDFTTKGNYLSGFVEYYRKNGRDMIGFSEIDPTVGVYQFKGNLAEITGTGIDAQLNFNAGKGLQYHGALLFSYNTDKVEQYERTTSVGAYLQSGDGSLGTLPLTPVIGKPIYSVFGYPWAGLDGTTGDPLGYFDGQISTNYTGMTNSTDLGTLEYFGSARPVFFGGFRNGLTYKGITASVNITYKLGYYFRNPTINYSSLASGWLRNNDFQYRWKQPGDENHTTVPSFAYPLNQARDNFYQYSAILVERADHIRIQDIQVSFNMGKVLDRSVWNTLNIYAYANNLGLLWKATDAPIDPDYIRSTFVNPRTYSLGMQWSF